MKSKIVKPEHKLHSTAKKHKRDTQESASESQLDASLVDDDATDFAAVIADAPDAKANVDVANDADASSKNSAKKVADFCLHTLDGNDRILERKSYAIHRIAFSQEQQPTFAAVARMNGYIEIWYTPYYNYRDWSFLKRIPPKENTTVESLIWLPGYRLVTAGLHADIVEWDIDTLYPKRNSGVYGSAIWAMALHPTKDLLATACQDGRVRVYDSNTLDFKFSFAVSNAADNENTSYGDHFSGNRLHAICFSDDGSRVFVGGFTGIYCFDFRDDVRSGSVQSNARLAYRVDINNGCCWSLCYVKQSKTVVAGDHRGFVHFIDAYFGTVLSQYKQHRADVLYVVCSSDGSKVFATGADPLVALFAPAAGSGATAGKWALVRGVRPTYHDLHALTMFYDGTIVCGGVDGFVYIYDTNEFLVPGKRKNKTMLEPSVQALGTSAMHLSQYNRLALIEGGNYMLSVIHIPAIDTSIVKDLSNGYNLPFFDAPKLALYVQAKTRGGWGIIASAISKNGQYVCYSCLDSLHLIRLNVDVAAGYVQSDDLDLYRYLQIAPGYHVTFGMDDRFLVVISRNNVLQVLDLQSMKLIVNMPLRDVALDASAAVSATKKDSCFGPNAIHGMAMSSQGSHVLVLQGERVLAWDLDPTALQHTQLNYAKPKWSFVLKNNTNVTATGMHCFMYKVEWLDQTHFYVLATGNVILLGDVARENYCFIGKRTGLPRASAFHRPFFKALQLSALQADAEPSSSTPVYLANGESIFKFCDKSLHKESNIMKQFHNILALEEFASTSGSSRELVLLRNNFEQYLLSLPDVVYRHRFGV